MSSLFGSTQNKPSSLFPSLGNNNPSNQQQQQPQQQQGSGGLFGSLGQAQQSQQQQTNSLFGGQQNQPQQQSSGLFGSSIQPQQQSSGLFGSQQIQQNQQQGGGGLFGATQNQPQQQNSLFGASQQQSGLFPQQQQQQQLGGSTFGASQSQNQPNNRSIWQPGNSLAPRGKTVPEQMQTLLEKWSPESSSCLFQHYFYNHVNPDTVPYYGPAQGEDEAKWEEALNNKPGEDAIPVLCKGFSSLGNRLRIQVQSVAALQARLHEINNSLTAMLQAHDVDISVRANDAKRRHVALSQRSLQLATKIQILRNRGYALDGAEESLRKKLLELERGAFDPRLNGRQEEIWARMVGLRERTRALQEETQAAGSQPLSSLGDGIDQDILKKTKKILGNYASDIEHLSRETDDVRKDFEAWEKGGGPALITGR